MNTKYMQIHELLEKKADITARFNLIPYDGSIEIKEKDDKQYIYIRKKALGKNTSTYVGAYSDASFAAISRLLKEKKEYRKQLRQIEKQLAVLGYTECELSPRVLLNIDFARANMKNTIYDQAILEGIATTFPDTESILENGKVNGMKASDVQKILNLKHAWEFILDKDVLSFPTSLTVLCHIASLINEGFYTYGGKIRSVPVSIGGTDYMPPLPVETLVKEAIDEIQSKQEDAVSIAISLCLYCMKAQIFNDGNKRASIIFANHYLISKGKGLIVVPDKDVPLFKQLLINYYEDKDKGEVHRFMKDKCWRRF